MCKRNWGELITKIMVAIKDYGPMTRVEVQEHLGLTKYDFGGCLARMCKETPTMPQRLHICGYTRDHERARKYPRAIYAHGPGENARKPPRTRKRDRMQSYKVQINRVRNSSVFNLSLRRDDIRQMKKNVRSPEVHMGQGS